MVKKGNHIHDKPQVAKVRHMSGSWRLQSPGVDFRNSGRGVAFWNSGSFTFSIRLVLRTTPGVTLKELREFGGQAVW